MGFDPKDLFDGRPRELYPEIPYGVYMVMGRGFFGWHCRFREIARGGIRCVKSPSREVYLRNAASLFEETYNLAYTQQKKNKDIAEGGSKGTILLDTTDQSKARDAFLKYCDSLLDIMVPPPLYQQETSENTPLYSHLKSPEVLFFGPDENTADYMDLGAKRAKERNYQYPLSFTTGKSQELGGVAHDVYGITTTGVHEYVLCLLKELGIEEENITKFQTGGPDGDLGSNEILISKDRTIAIVDGSGVAHDPAGLNREELERLAKSRKPIKFFNPKKIGPNGFLVPVEQMPVTLPDGTTFKSGTVLRNQFPLLKYAKADLFVPCGGRPASITLSNVKSVLQQWKYVVEGANLFFTDDARMVLEKNGIILFKDASSNKGGVTCSSFEVLAALSMEPQIHKECLTVPKNGVVPKTYDNYVQ